MWPVYFHKPGGKWAYIDYVVMTKPDRWIEFKELIQQALDTTPEAVRETRIKEIGDYWTVIMPNNPLGYPIMVVGHAD